MSAGFASGENDVTMAPPAAFVLHAGSIGGPMPTRTDSRPPWKRRNPAKTKKKTLSARQKHEARARAHAAGRRYPNLVDNMAMARKSAKKKPAKKSVSRKKTIRRT
jgi:hypothetical protein